MSEEKKSPEQNEKEQAARLREAELDEFWDISALIPPKKNPPPRHHAPVELAEITVEPDAAQKARDTAEQALSAARDTVDRLLTETRDPAAHGALTHAQEALQNAQTRLTRTSPPKPVAPPTRERGSDEPVIKRYIPPHTPDEQARKTAVPDDEYTPQDSMLHRVRIYRWKTTYQYYEDFCRQATALYHRRGEPCAPVSFFSYVPQYSQMSRAQLGWYLYWRDGVRRGEILPADYSYILLYIYEIINLSDTMDVHVGQQQLCALRKAFYGTYPRLGHLLNEWICDYSLIHHLPPPALADLGSVADCTLKEFYVPSTEASARYAASLMAFGSNYDYTKSKFAAGDNRALYDRHMIGALCACISDTGEAGERMAGAELEESRLIRDAYTGALCSHRVKRRIEIDYCSFARSHELRILVTDIMKYTENRLRAYLGVKSRLGLYALPQSFRDCIDRYLRQALPSRERAPRPEVRQEYEALYDVPKTAFSAAHAAEIEQASWNTTERLIAAFGEPDAPVQPTPPPEPPTPAPMPPAPPTAPESAEPSNDGALLAEKLGDLNEFLNLALRDDVSGQRNFARVRGEMIDSIADRINEIAAEILGDVLLEEGESGGYTVIEDYRDILEHDS